MCTSSPRTWVASVTSPHITPNSSRNNILINSHMLEAAHLSKVKRYLYTSSACVYPSHLQGAPEAPGASGVGRGPRRSEKGYGWEKLFAEQLTSYFAEEHGMDVRMTRFHNIYGPLGTYKGGREKAPAAISVKLALAEQGSRIEIWGDGKQTRGFCYIDDSVEGVSRIMEYGVTQPLNLGSSEIITVDGLVDLIAQIAGKRIVKVHDTTRPQGVPGPNSDNTLIRSKLGWEPPTRLREGLIPLLPVGMGPIGRDRTCSSARTCADDQRRGRRERDPERRIQPSGSRTPRETPDNLLSGTPGILGRGS